MTLLIILLGFLYQAASECHAPYNYIDGDANGPANWGNLCSEWQACRGGLRQSPIDIQTRPKPQQRNVPGALVPSQSPQSQDAKPLRVLLHDKFNMTVFNTGHTLEAACEGSSPLGGKVEPDVNLISGGPLGCTYEMLQFHFHAPSEHTLDGVRYDAELHLVHKNTCPGQNDLTVLGVFIQLHPRQKSDLLEQVLAGYATIPSGAPAGTHVDWQLNLAADLEDLRRETDLYSYAGSLTTPPCSETVTWMVMGKPVRATSDQIDKLHQIMGSNARPVQPIGSRQLTNYKLSGKKLVLVSDAMLFDKAA